MAAIQGIADVHGVEPADLNARLYDYIDPDALDALFAPVGDEMQRDVGHVEFTMLGCSVVVHADGAVVVERTTDAASFALSP